MNLKRKKSNPTPQTPLEPGFFQWMVAAQSPSFSLARQAQQQRNPTAAGMKSRAPETGFRP